jgi:glucose-6-phosphate 1-dehydrogenase
MENNFDFGLVGLGVMGRNFILNVADHDFSAIGLDTDQSKVDSLRAEAENRQVDGTVDVSEFVKALRSPRKVMLLVPAGKPVDSVIDSLLPHLDKGDLIIDGGNSFFADTDRRIEYLSVKALNRKLLDFFFEDQIYRIDHYLGKETVQNLMVTRFGNTIYEPLWNRNYIHRVEITAAESVGVEKRGGYYEDSGALRDMVQNHLLQLVSMVAMEPPAVLDADAIRNEKLKLFQSLRKMTTEEIRKDVIRGQYLASTIKGDKVPGYREEEGVKSDSRTETYVAMKFFIDNWRWADVPFYVRTGKRLPTRVSEVVIHFKPNHHHLFKTSRLVNNQNMLVFRIQPNEGILLKFGLKVPGAGYDMETVNMDFHYDDLTDSYVPEAYERLILDCMQGDATLYARGDSVEAAWQFIDPILDAWKSEKEIPIYGYPAGTWGPENSDDLIKGENMMWRYPCKNLADDSNYCEL